MTVGNSLLSVTKGNVGEDERNECLKRKGIELRWFHNYLTGRSQVVSVNGAISDSHDIDVGVPQGSVLGRRCVL